MNQSETLLALSADKNSKTRQSVYENSRAAGGLERGEGMGGGVEG